MRYRSLYEFTNRGMDVFRQIFEGTFNEDAFDPSDSHLVAGIDRTKPFSPVQFDTAKELARAVLGSIGSLNLPDLLPRAGLWAWLTFILRDQLFRLDANGKRRLGAMHRWYPSDPNDWQKSQRHLVRMPVQLFYSFGIDADHLLCTPPSVLPEIREQLTSQQDMFNLTFQRVARHLYFDGGNARLKRGAGGKGGGSPRRLAKIRQQLDVTWDLEELGVERILEMLPSEFDRFRTHEPAS